MRLGSRRARWLSGGLVAGIGLAASAPCTGAERFEYVITFDHVAVQDVEGGPGMPAVAHLDSPAVVPRKQLGGTPSDPPGGTQPEGPGGAPRDAVANWRVAPAFVSLKDTIVGNIASTLWVLMGTIGAVFVIACANVANLMLVRADARRPEIAIRAALGANRSQLARLVLRDAARVTLIGAGLGLIGAVAVTDLLRTLLYEISPLDVPALAGATLSVLGIAALAAYLPARRAARIDPMEALRHE